MLSNTSHVYVLNAYYFFAYTYSSYQMTIVSLQLHKTVQKKHTLPNCKARFKPFLPPQVSPNRSENVSLSVCYLVNIGTVMNLLVCF
jgi:hypothetical protein